MHNMSVRNRMGIRSFQSCLVFPHYWGVPRTPHMKFVSELLPASHSVLQKYRAAILLQPRARVSEAAEFCILCCDKHVFDIGRPMRLWSQNHRILEVGKDLQKSRRSWNNIAFLFDLRKTSYHTYRKFRLPLLKEQKDSSLLNIFTGPI